MSDTLSHVDFAEETLAGRRQPSKQPPTLDSQDESSARSIKLRVVNETRERLDSNASFLGDLGSSSSIPVDWTAREFAENKDQEARWRDSVDSTHEKRSAVPTSFHARAVDVLVKLRLLPVMKALQDPGDKGGLNEALSRAENILEFAVKENASSALQGRCCYYIGVAMYLLDDDEAEQFFVGALDAKGIYEEGRWAQQWTNHYDSLGDLSPNRVATSERPVSWTGSIGGYMRSEKKKYAGSSILSSQKGDTNPQKSPARQRKQRGEGIQATTPVSQRFSLDIQDDPRQEHSFGSQTPGSRVGSSIGGGGESIPSFSSWNSSAHSQTFDPSRPVLDTDGLHSPKCSHVSPTTSQNNETGEDQLPSIDLDTPFASPHHRRSKSVTFSPITPTPNAETHKQLNSSRRKSSRFHVNAPSVLEKVKELSIDSTDGDELPSKEAPPAPWAESEQEFY